jgi:protein-disulfide isomerase
MNNISASRSVLTVGLSLGSMLWAWSGNCQSSDTSNIQQTCRSGPSLVVARVGDVTICQNDVDLYIGREVATVELQLYSLRARALDSMIDSLLIQKEAETQHIGEDQLLLGATMLDKVPTHTDIEREWATDYDALRPLGDVVGHYQVFLNLESHERAESLRRYLASLRKANDVAILLTPPTNTLRIRPGDSYLGSQHGSSEIVLFQDYECPFCRALDPELQSTLKEDPTLANVRITIKQLPLSMHAGAFDAAVGAVCATRQQRFPIMHSLLVANQDHSIAGMIKTATQAGLDLSRFTMCVASESAKAEVLRDMDEARLNGIEATPTIYVDGVQFILPDNPKAFRSALDATVKHVALASGNINTNTGLIQSPAGK